MNLNIFLYYSPISRLYDSSDSTIIPIKKEIT